MSYRYTQAVLDGTKALRCGKLNVMQALAEWANEEGTSWHPIREIADRARLQERAVKYVLNALEAEGFLIIERGHGRGNTSRYTIVLAALEYVEIKRAISSENVQIVASEKVQLSAEKVQEPSENVQIVAENVQIPSREVNRQEPSVKPPPEPSPAHAQDEERSDRDDGKIISIYQNGRLRAPITWVHEGAAIVLGANDLTVGQHDDVVLFCQEHRDERLTPELVEYAASICKAKNKRDLRYFFGIIGKRLDNPAWVDVPTELANSPYQKGGDTGYGNKTEDGTGGPNGTGFRYNGAGGAGIVGVIEAQSRPVRPGFKAALERRIARDGQG